MEGHTSLEPSGLPLKAFPAEILNLITFHLDWSSIMDLWCCGDVTLHRLMKHRGVTRFEVSIREKTPDFIVPLGWRFFADLSDLSLHLNNLNPVYMDSIRVGLQSMSSNLRKLSLKFPDAELALFSPNAPIESSSNGIPIAETAASFKSPSILWFVSDKLPNLEFLELNSFSVNGRLCDADIGHLPHSLTELRLRTHHNHLTSDVMLHLGPQIETLWISFKSQAGSVISLPPQLKSLNILQILTGSLIGLVPSNLTSFHARHWPIDIENLVCLPPCTQSIRLKLLPGEETRAQLPIGLKGLSLSSHGPNVLYKQIFIPSGLVSLTCYSDIHLSQSHWPKHLTSLQIHDALSTGELEAFPDTLTHLLVNFGGSIPQETYETLLGAIPPSIMQLHLFIDDSMDNFIFPSSKFPLLRHLSLYGPFEPSKDLLQGLSKHMEKLILRCKGIWDEQCLSLLPSNLQYLELSFPSSCTPTCFKYLPRHLTQVSLHIMGTATANNFQMLPRSLTFLNLPTLDAVESNAWSELPNTLRTLDLGAKLTEIDFSNFPTKLRWFSAPKATILIPPTYIPHHINHILLGSDTIIHR